MNDEREQVIADGTRRDAAMWRRLMERDGGDGAKHERLRITAQRAVEDWLDERARA